VLIKKAEEQALESPPSLFSGFETGSSQNPAYSR